MLYSACGGRLSGYCADKNASKYAAPRPVKLRQKPSTGEWFLWEYSSPLSGIRIPASQDPWA